MPDFEKYFTASKPDEPPTLGESPFTEAPPEGLKLPEVQEEAAAAQERRESPPPIPEGMRRTAEETARQAARRQQERQQTLEALGAAYYEQMQNASRGGYGDASYAMYERAKELYEDTQRKLREQKQAA